MQASATRLRLGGDRREVSPDDSRQACAGEDHEPMEAARSTEALTAGAAAVVFAGREPIIYKIVLLVSGPTSRACPVAFPQSGSSRTAAHSTHCLSRQDFRSTTLWFA